MLNNYIPKVISTKHLTGLKDQIDIKPINKWTELNNINNIQLSDSEYTFNYNFNLNIYILFIIEKSTNNKNYINYKNNSEVLLRSISSYIILVLLIIMFVILQLVTIKFI